MLIAIVLVLQSETPGHLPAYLGRANYTATLTRLDHVAPGLGKAIHDGDGPKPLTCSGLLNAPTVRQTTPIDAGKLYYVRMTGLTPDVGAALNAGLLAEMPPTWELDNHTFQVVDAICDRETQPWSGQTTYETLTAAQFQPTGSAHAKPERRVTLRFNSPTSFKSQGMQVPIPLPGLVFGSLVERWNAFSPVTLSPEMRRFAQERIAISRYKLHSRPVTQKNQGVRMGGVGEVTYVALGGDRYWLSVMQMLADFALYSGAGVQTATGMGQVGRVR